MVGIEQVAICITNYNRYELLFRSFEKVLHDPRISRIVISDDCSDFECVSNIAMRIGDMVSRGIKKVDVVSHNVNVGCYHNKAKVLSLVGEEYAILLDSDNVIDTSYLDALFRVPEMYLDGHTILAPDFARPHFKYTQFSGTYLDSGTIKQHIPTMARTQFDCLINCANYVVPVKEYLRVFDPDFNPWTCDTVYQLYNWLKTGNGMYVVPGMQYDHLIHDGSHYKEHVHKVPGLFEEITQKIMKL